MRVKVEWIVDLPLKFHIGDNFKRTSLTQFSFSIDEISFELLKSKTKNIIEQVKITLHEEYDDNYLPSYENHEYLSKFSDMVSYKASKAMQSFLDGFSKSTNAEYYQIFDGNDFVTAYEEEISPNILNGSSGGFEFGRDRESHIYLDDEIFDKSIKFACKEKNTIDYAWYYLRDAEHLIDIGKYEIALINMAIMIEFLVKAQLSEFLDDNGYFSKERAKEIKNIFGEKASFVNRYFRYGLSLVTNKYLPDEIHNTIDSIYQVRNNLAHGKRLQEIEMINEEGESIKETEMGSLFRHLLIDVYEIYYYFRDLNS